MTKHVLALSLAAALLGAPILAAAQAPAASPPASPAAAAAAPAAGTEDLAPTDVRVIFTGADNRQFDVWVDGQRVGLTPMQVDFTAGSRVVTASAERLAPIIERIDFKPGTRQEVVLPVEKLTAANYRKISDNIISLIQFQPGNAHGMLISAMTAKTNEEREAALVKAENAGGPNPTAKLIRGRMLQDQRKYTESLVEVEAGIALEPRMSALHRQRARTLTQMTRLKDAFDAAGRAIELDGGDWENFYVRGVIQMEMKENAAALKDLEKALSLSPENFEVQDAIREIKQGGSSRSAATPAASSGGK